MQSALLSLTPAPPPLDPRRKCLDVNAAKAGTCHGISWRGAPVVAAQPYYSLPAGTQEVDANNPENLLECTLYGKFQVTTANSVTGLGDKPQIFDCGIYNVLGEARDGYWDIGTGWPPVGSFDFSTTDGGYWWKSTSAAGPTRNYTAYGKLDTPNGRTSILSTHIDGANPSWYTFDEKHTCYTLYGGKLRNPTDKAECE